MDSTFRDDEIRSNQCLEGQKRLLLNSWKEIARYLGRGVRTVQRWERNLALPVHRPKGRDRSATLALSIELDEWLRKTPVRSVAHWQQKALALESEMERRKQAEIAARKLAAIVESSDDAIASNDVNGIVTSWNAAAERIFGYAAEEMIGQPINMIVPPELHAEEECILARIRRGERVDHYETIRLTKSGKKIDISLRVSPLQDDRGQVIGATKIARDITAQKRMEEALRSAEKLAVAGRMALTLAHEINNP